MACFRVIRSYVVVHLVEDAVVLLLQVFAGWLSKDFGLKVLLKLGGSTGCLIIDGFLHLLEDLLFLLVEVSE